MNGLILHSGANAATRDEVGAVTTPAPEGIWHPIPHLTIRDLVAAQVTQNGLTVAEESYGLWKDGLRAFGLLGLRGTDGADTPTDFQMVLGWRNSHDKSFPAAGALGSHVFVCDNLAFSGEVTFARKHTINVLRDLPGLVSAAVGRLVNMRGWQERRIEAYKQYEIVDRRVHDIVIQALDARVIGATRIPAVLAEWRQPRHPEFTDRTAWSLFNAFTQVLKSVSLPELPSRTVRLHGLLDQVIGLEAVGPGHLGDAVRGADVAPEEEAA